ncbi:hypothetical protein BACPEC_01366 [[Bacteroides] pectinophilus ATCC 43243]|uniref:Uncharacterized protein n=1 Tax=[Bacteroides] pectinophilus ATCC 43243 TaxID=483218 RepID=B7AT96_9FIRM|nr:hypothetical protein BACPEC_01366 [[Bacteroides] pectinophilus ATCC 43243]
MKRKFKRKNEKKHILVILLIIIVTAAAVVGAAAVIFRVNTIEYIGDDHYSDEELTEKNFLTEVTRMHCCIFLWGSVNIKRFHSFRSMR